MNYQLLSVIFLLLFASCVSHDKTKRDSNVQNTPASISKDKDWLFWRGPSGTGVSEQTNLPGQLSLEKDSLLWTHEIQGGGVPVIAGGRAYQFGYYGVEDDLMEALVCFDAATGKILWERTHADFIS
ncbi:MAG: hypothetical protein HOI70_04055, partial [Opitutae bacterium]|nr:hypothetical protein [Opitutae bacterium]